jgi:predicted RNA-binding protein
VVFYSVRTEGDELFDVLDDSGKVTGKLTMQDFADLLNQSKAT